jgi:hypothetical protein
MSLHPFFLFVFRSISTLSVGIFFAHKLSYYAQFNNNYCSNSPVMVVQLPTQNPFLSSQKQNNLCCELNAERGTFLVIANLTQTHHLKPMHIFYPLLGSAVLEIVTNYCKPLLLLKHSVNFNMVRLLPSNRLTQKDTTRRQRNTE